MTLSPAEMEAKINKLETNMTRLDSIVNGDVTTEVTTDNGTVPSLAKALDQITATDPTLINENGYLNSIFPLMWKRTIIEDWADRLGGGPAVYIPTIGFMGNDTAGTIESVNLAAYADTKLTGYVKVPIAVTEVVQTIYYDINEAGNPLKLVTFPALVPRDPIRYRPLMVLYGVDAGIWSPYRWESTRDLSRTSFVNNAYGIWFDNAAQKLFIPRLYGWSNTTTWGLLPPTDNLFREYDVSSYLAETSATFVWLDIADLILTSGTSTNAVKFTTGYNSVTNAKPSRDGGYIVLIGVFFQREFHAINPDIQFATMVENEFGCGREDNDLAERFYGDSVPVALTRPESLALGFTRGWTSLSATPSGAFYGGLFRQAVNGPKELILRYYIETDVANNFGTEPRNYIHQRNSDGTISYSAFTSSVKKKHSEYLTEYIDIIRFTNNNTYVGVWVGSFGIASGQQRVFGLQFGFANRFPALSLRDYPRRMDEKGARMRALESVFPSVGKPFDPILPSRLYLHPTRPYNIYFDQIFGPYAHGRYRATVVSKPSGLGPEYSGEFEGGHVTLPTSRLGSTAEFCFTDLAGVQSKKTRFNVSTRILNPTTVDALNSRILIIGDSLNNYTGCGVQTIKRLRDMGATITPIGTMEMSSEVPSDGSDTELGEARGGREFADYIYMNTDAVAPVAAGDEPIYLAQTNIAKRAYNPFLKVPTSGDISSRPDMIFNGYIFDMAWYLSRFGFANPDVVVINLHTNDISQGDDPTSLLQIQKGLATMVPQIRNALPSAKIVLVYNAYGRLANEVRWEGEHWAGLKAFVKFIRDFGDSNVVLAPAYCTVQRDAGFKYTSVQDPDTGAYTDTIDDATHYAESGIKEHAEMLAQFIAGILTGA